MKKLGIPAGITMAVVCAALQGCKEPKTPVAGPSAAPTVLPATEEVAVATVATEEVYGPETVPVAPVVKPLPPPPPPPVVAPAPAAPAPTYTVKKGDTLSGIALAHKVKQADIVAANPGMNPNKIYAGKTIRMPGAAVAPAAPAPAPAVKPAAPAVKPAPAAPAAPASEAGVYTVKKGDTLSGIALAHKVKQADIVKANPGMDPNRISAGKKINLPGAVAAAPAAPAKSAKVEETNKKVEPAPAPKAAPAEPAPAAVDPADVTPAPAPAPDPNALPEYVVKENEDVYAVAINFSLSPAVVRELNGLKGDSLTPGQRIKLPAGTVVSE